MLELPHVAVGVVIATKIPDPIIALPLALMSHFAFDFLPHWNPSLYTEFKKFGKPRLSSNLVILADTTAALILGFWVAASSGSNPTRFLTIILAAFLAVAPDVIEGFYFYLGAKSRLLEKLVKFQHDHQTNAPILPGLLTQAAVLIICLYLILSK